MDDLASTAQGTVAPPLSARALNGHAGRNGASPPTGEAAGSAGESRAAAGLAPVTVVIVNYNAGAVLADCLEGVLSQAAEVVVVDNASDPRVFEPIIARFEADRRVRVIRSP